MLLRNEIKPGDDKNVFEILSSTNFFRTDEIEVAVSLLDPNEYNFVFLEENDKTIGFTCYGLIPCTLHSFDLYWIAVHQDYQGKGYGKILLQETEKLVEEAKGKNVYIETSSQPLYLSTRKFYEKQGYVLEAVIKEFYNDNDDKCIYSKRLFK
ncbi:MAG: ribosomal-protein-alanine N-acetyltransferase [Alphaproteobacteria bacterium ADurb.Bin438]|nr:MAG: ribosomal-protein-alanine N-acetyltransferase [Alphaproteobacteria bacterium ADurb.Bin438]